jgi:DNA-3-methyladenine glycosylase II
VRVPPLSDLPRMMRGMTRCFTLVPLGEFSLRESALFGFGQRSRPSGGFDGIMRLAFCLDGGYERQVGVELRQDETGVHAVVHGAGDLTTIRLQTARLLSLDHDARGFVEVGRRDPVIRRLQVAAPGLRPPLFHSPYEAAAWSVLSTRRPAWQMNRVRAALSEAVGRTFVLAGAPGPAFPTPHRLLRVGAFPGIDADRLERMHGVARAAADGLLEVQRLRDLGPEQAVTDLQRLAGIGPFYAWLIVVRALGLTDVLPEDEPQARELARELYGIDELVSPEQFRLSAEVWRPWRTWVTVLIRAVGPRMLGSPVGNVRERLSA